MSKSLIPWKRKESRTPAQLSETHPIEALHRQMDELFDSFLGDFGGWFRTGALAPRWSEVTPSIEVSETDDSFQVTAELPGMDEKDVEVTLDNNLLTIKGEKKAEREEKGRNYHFTERSYGSFQRMIPIPDGVDKDAVKASFKKGVLPLNMPKTEQARKQSRKIQITAG